MAQHFRNTERQDTEVQDELQNEFGGAVAEAPEALADGLDVPVEQIEETYVALDESAPLTMPLDDPLDIPAPVATPSPAASEVPDPFAAPVAVELDEVAFAQAAAAEPTPTPAPITTSWEPAPEIDRTGEPAISMKNVTMIYPSQPAKPALNDVSLDIYPGEFVFIVGHSGSGKSTFIRLLTREIKASKGQVLIGGQDLGRMRNRKVPILRRQIGCVFQDFKLLPDKTVAQNVAFALECIGKPRSVINAQVPEVLRLVGLGEKMDAYPDQLSGGEQQRVAVARAMVNRPPLLICDEPTGNLDPAISLGIMKLLDAINRNGTTVVMATHDRQMVDAMQRRVIQLDSGHLVRDQEGGYGVYNIEGGEGYYV